MTDAPTIVSFYTNDWEYPEYAERLKDNCKDLGLTCYIQERPSTGDYIQNTSIKPYFIQDALERYKGPILWIDCDGTLLKPPTALEHKSVSQFDFAAKQYKGPVSRSWHVGTLWFNYTEASIKFIKDWCAYSSIGTDENSFEMAWQDNRHLLNVYPLPPEYFIILTKYNCVPPDDAVIVHRLSTSPDKMKRKYPKSHDIEGNQ